MNHLSSPAYPPSGEDGWRPSSEPGKGYPTRGSRPAKASEARPPVVFAGGTRAFTLLEIMVVVGIAALVMTISIPFVQRTIRRDSVVQAIRTVEDACHSARAMAIFGNGAADLVISMAEGTFRVQPSSSTAPSPLGGMGTDPETGAPKPAGPQPKPFQGSLGEDAVIELLAVNFVEAHAEDEAHVRFHPNGTSDEFTMVVRVGTKAWRKFTLDIMTGLPKTEIIR